MSVFQDPYTELRHRHGTPDGGRLALSGSTQSDKNNNSNSSPTFITPVFSLLGTTTDTATSELPSAFRDFV